MTADAASLRDEIALLEASIADARAEHDRGELGDDGLAAIVASDGARLERARERLAAHEADVGPASGAIDPAQEIDGPAARASRRRRRRQPQLLAVAVACVVIAAAVIAIGAAHEHAATGPAHLTTEGKVRVLLVQGEAELQGGHLAPALTAFDAVLALDPTDAEAVVEAGWLRYEVALGARDAAQVRLGADELRRAVVIAPDDAASHLYDGIVLWQYDHDDAAALDQLTRAAELPETTVEVDLTVQFLGIVARSERTEHH